MALRSLIVAGMLSLLSVLPSNAGWQEDAWDETKIRDHPAVTFRPPDTVLIVFTEKALTDSRAEGLSLDQAVTAFIAWYGPKHCYPKELMDLSKPIRALKVEVFMQEKSDLYDRSPDARIDAQSARHYIEHAQKAHPGPSTYLDESFHVANESVVMTIDYAPSRTINCIVPEMTTREKAVHEAIQRRLRKAD